MRACTLLFIIGAYIGYNRGLYGEALSFAVQYSRFAISTLQIMLSQLAKQRKCGIFRYFFAKKLLKSFAVAKKAVPLHRIRTIRG